MVILIPTVSLWGRASSLSLLLSQLAEGWECKEVVELHFGSCEFLSAEAIAVLAGFALHRDYHGLSTDLVRNSIGEKVHNQLRKIGFLELFDQHESIVYGLSIPLYRNDGADTDTLFAYIDNQVMSRPEMPGMSEALHKEIRRSFVEIFGNIFRHSGSPIGGLLCGQIYPNRKEIQLAFFDSGIGICRRVRDYNAEISDDRSAIAWAVEKGNSTLADVEGPRGLGLYLLRDFLKVNNGELHLYANKGYYVEHTKQQQPELLRDSLPGTLVDLRIQIMPSDVKYGFRETQ